jgi:hypothetical protein
LVDVLFVIDDSGSMIEEQEALGAAFPTMAEALATGDLDGDGRVDFPPVTDLHAGVVTTDLGLLAPAGEERSIEWACTTGGSLGGDQGLLLLPDPTLECAGEMDGYFVRYREGEPLEAFTRAFACRALVGTDGCGFEQPLEAALVALTPSTSPLRFAAGAVGHGDGLNAGFVRAASILAVVVLTDEDDGSLANTTYLEVETREELVLGEAWFHPLSRYADGFVALRAEDPDRFVAAVIAGLPVDLAPTDPSSPVDYDRILADPRMQRVFIDADDGIDVIPSCEVDGLGRAIPPRRLVTLARDLGDRALVQSICQEDLRPALGVITARLGKLVRETWCVDGEAGR